MPRQSPTHWTLAVATAAVAALCWIGACRAVVLNPDGIVDVERTPHVCRDRSGGLVEAVVADGACAGFIPRKGAEPVLFDAPINGSVLAFDGGRTVVALHDALYGKLNADGTFVSGDGDAERDPPLVLIYRDGKRTGAYRWSEVLARPRLAYSATFCGDYVRHCPPRVTWLRSYRPTGSGARELVLETTSMREIVLDLTRGTLAQARDAAQWAACELIVQGPTARQGDRGQMGPVRALKGEAPPALDFTLAPEVPARVDGSEQTLCLRRATAGWVATAELPIPIQAAAHDAPALVQAERASAPQIEISLRGTDFFYGMIRGESGAIDIWHLRLRADRPIQSMTVGLAGSPEPPRRANFDVKAQEYDVDLYDLPADAPITLRIVDGHGVDYGPTTRTFDTLAAVRALPDDWKRRLQRDPNLGFDLLPDGRNGPYLFAPHLRTARCALRELRYGIDRTTPDRRDVFPPCHTESLDVYHADTYRAEMAGDVFLEHKLPQDVAYVTLQLVYFDGSVSKTVTVRRAAATHAGAQVAQ